MTSRKTSAGEGPAAPTKAAVERLCSGKDPLEVVYQPIVDLESGAARGYEALARFPQDLAIPPGAWFAAAAAAGVAGKMEALVVEHALAARGDLPEGSFLAINVTPDALATDELAQALDAAAPLDGVVIELTEQIGSPDVDRMRVAVRDLEKAGAELAVNDVGEGHASLRYVLLSRPRYLKLDRSLVSDIDRDEAKVAAMEAFGAFASRMGALVVAEGVERVEELDTLVRLGVPLAQGFLLGEPASAIITIDAVVGERIRKRAAERDRGGGVRHLVERAPVAFEAEGPEGLTELFAEDERHDAAVVVDERSEPSGLIERGAHERGEHPRVPTVVSPDIDPAEIARRAMTRPHADRFLPLVCCDARGRYVGIVRVELLVEELARADAALPQAARA